jgi:hypothetical protein
LNVSVLHQFQPLKNLLHMVSDTKTDLALHRRN